jgi:uncharacterized protein (TIGR02145 family)
MNQRNSCLLFFLLLPIIIVFYNCAGGDDSPAEPTPPVLSATIGGTVWQSTIEVKSSIMKDGGSPVTSRGFCYSLSVNPTVANDKIETGSGTGEFGTTLTGLSSNTPYHVRPFATNSNGTSYGDEIVVKTLPGTPGEMMTDIDGNMYHTVIIYERTWLIENLRTTRYRNGEAIPNVTSDAEWKALTTGALCTFNNQTSNISRYGRLYNWAAVNDSRNIAPAGWHVPTKEEWDTLLWAANQSALGLKKSSAQEWGASDQSHNTTGFSALSSGARLIDSWFVQGPGGGGGFWWSSTEAADNTQAYSGSAYADSGVFPIIAANKKFGYSVRLIKDK